jgi:hypothetical protein
MCSSWRSCWEREAGFGREREATLQFHFRIRLDVAFPFAPIVRDGARIEIDVVSNDSGLPAREQKLRERTVSRSIDAQSANKRFMVEWRSTLGRIAIARANARPEDSQSLCSSPFHPPSSGLRFFRA